MGVALIQNTRRDLSFLTHVAGLSDLQVRGEFKGLNFENKAQKGP